MFYFHSWHADDRIGDDEGIEFATAEEARVEAVRMFGELLLDQASEFWGANVFRIEVTDANGSLLFTLSFAAACEDEMSTFADTQMNLARRSHAQRH